MRAVRAALIAVLLAVLGAAVSAGLFVAFLATLDRK